MVPVPVGAAAAGMRPQGELRDVKQAGEEGCLARFGSSPNTWLARGISLEGDPLFPHFSPHPILFLLLPYSLLVLRICLFG